MRAYVSRDTFAESCSLYTQRVIITYFLRFFQSVSVCIGSRLLRGHHLTRTVTLHHDTCSSANKVIKFPYESEIITDFEYFRNRKHVRIQTGCDLSTLKRWNPPIVFPTCFLDNPWYHRYVTCNQISKRTCGNARTERDWLNNRICYSRKTSSNDWYFFLQNL